MGVSQCYGWLFGGSPMIRIHIFLGLYWGPLFWETTMSSMGCVLYVCSAKFGNTGQNMPNPLALQMVGCCASH